MVIRRKMLRGRRPPQNAPDPRIAEPPRLGSRRTIRVAKAEGSARLRIVPAFALGEAFHVLRIEAIRRVVAWELGDASGIGMTGNLPVGNSYCDPDGPLTRGTGPHQLHDPCLLGISDGERLAFIAIAMLLDETAHHL